MNRSLFSAANGMKAHELQINVIANNLANVNTTGFKRSRANFQDLLYQTLRVVGTLSATGNQVPTGIQVGLGTKASAVQKIFIQGDFIQTENQLDLAIEGKGFFPITLPDGTTGYTRDGSFKLDSTGAIVTSDGYPMSDGFTIDPTAIDVSIDSEGNLSYTTSGSTAPTSVGQFTLAGFANPAGLKSIGKNLFIETDASGTAATGTPGQAGTELGTLQQGFLENANVSIVEELVNMIVAQRAYEINSKAIQTADDMLQTVNNVKR